MTETRKGFEEQQAVAHKIFSSFATFSLSFTLQFPKVNKASVKYSSYRVWHMKIMGRFLLSSLDRPYIPKRKINIKRKWFETCISGQEPIARWRFSYYYQSWITWLLLSVLIGIFDWFFLREHYNYASLTLNDPWMLSGQVIGNLLSGRSKYLDSHFTDEKTGSKFFMDHVIISSWVPRWTLALT